MTSGHRWAPKDILHTAELLRLGQSAAAYEKLAQQVDDLTRRLADLSPRDLALLTPLMQQTLDAQARGDHIGVADLLEYEVLPQLLTLNLVRA